MSGKAKALYCKIVALVLAIITVVSIFAGLGPILTIKTADVGLHEEYATGRYTAGITKAELNISVKNGLGYLKNAKYVNAVISIQGKDTQIRINQEFKAEVQKDLAHAYITGASESTIKGYEDRIKSYDDIIKEYQNEIAAILATFTEEELVTFEEKLRDDDFIEQVGLYYGTLSLFSDVDFEALPEYTENVPFIITFLVGLIIFFVMLLFIVIYTVINIIATVINFIRFGVKIWNADDTLVEKMYPDLLSGLVGALVVTLFILNAFNGFAASFGSGFKWLVALYIIANTIRGISKILLADKLDGEAITKFAIALVAALVFVGIVCSFTGFHVSDSIMEDAGDYLNTHFEAQKKIEADKYIAECPYDDSLEKIDYLSKTDSVASSRASAIVNEAFKKNALIAIGYDLVTALVVGIAFICCVERLGAKTIKNKYLKEEKQYGHQAVAGVLLIICLLVPNFLFITPTLGEKEAAYKVGEYKIQLDDYTVEGSPAYVKYNAMLELQKQANDAIPELEKAASEATDPAIKKVADNALIDAKRNLEIIDSAVEMYETSEKKDTLWGVIYSVLFTVTSFMYIFAVKPLGKIVNDILPKSKDNVAPAEEAPAEEAPVEAAPAEEAPAEEAPAEAAPEAKEE